MGDDLSCLHSNPNLEFNPLYVAFMKFKKLEDCIGCDGNKEGCDKKILAYSNRKELLMIDEMNLHRNYIKSKSLSSRTASP